MDDNSIIITEYDYKGYHFQRMAKDNLWYVTHDNKIVNWSQYRHDIESWIDHMIKMNQHG